MDTKKIMNLIFIKLTIIFTAIYLVVLVAFFNIVPWFFNLAAETYDNEFQIATDGITWTNQYIIVASIVYIMSSVIMYRTCKFAAVNKKKELYDEFTFKQKLVKVPSKIYVNVITTINLTLAVLHPITIYGFRGITIILLLVFSSIIILISSFVNLHARYLVNRVMQKYSNGAEEFNFKSKLLTKEKKDLFPLFNTFLIILALVGYTVVVQENADYYHRSYKIRFGETFTQTEYFDKTQVENMLISIKSNENNEHFFMYKIDNGSYYEVGAKSGDEKLNLSLFYTKYIDELSMKYDGIVYENYGDYVRGYVKKVNISGTDYYVGVKYDVNNIPHIIYFVSIYFIIVGIFIAVTLFNKNTYEFLIEKFEKIVKNKGKNPNEELIPIISDDEFGELAYLYNKLSVLTAEYIKNIEDKHSIMIKQAQLASVGEVASSIVYDLNLPIIEIKEDLDKLSKEIINIGENEKYLLFRMTNCADKIIKIVGGVKSQMGNLDDSQNTVFKVSDVIEDAKIVSYNEIIKNKCTFIVKVIDDLSVYGNPTKLGQVVTNLILNSIQAYNNKGGKIEITVMKAPQNRVMIKVQDYATGIPENMKEYIFKNILTTKGTAGTGLGLYISYSVIKGNFSGDMSFESDVNQGSTFYITIPVYNENNKNIEKGV